MRKYSKWLLVLGVFATFPGVSSADGFLSGKFRPLLPFTSSAEKARNQAMAEKVADALRQAQIKGHGIIIEFEDGVVSLDGRVHDASHLSLAKRAAAMVPGVDRVDSKMELLPQVAAKPAPPKVEAPVAKTEPAPEQSVVAVTKPEPKPEPAPQPAPKAADPIFRSASFADSGTQDFAPQPTPAPQPAPAPELSAQEVAGKLVQGMAQHNPGLIQEQGLEVHFSNGTVTLAGEISSPAARQAAEASAQAAAATLPQVNQIMNRLAVAQPAAPVAMSASVQQAPHPMQMRPSQVSMHRPVMPGPGMAPGAMGVSAGTFNRPNLPRHAWPSYAPYPNSAAISYPTQYSASAWPYIGPFYPYPQVPMGWREVSLEWDDGHWQLNFNQEKDKWYWLLNPKNW